MCETRDLGIKWPFWHSRRTVWSGMLQMADGGAQQTVWDGKAERRSGEERPLTESVRKERAR